jgi:hypothetical protein
MPNALLPRPWRYSRRCPICRRGGCIVAGPSAVAAVCVHTESKQRIGTIGWLHVLDNGGPLWSSWRCSLQRLAKG